MANTSGTAAALIRSTPGGGGMAVEAGTTAFSAYPPPPTTAQTSSPTVHPSTADPIAETVPDSSRPSVSGDPGGGG